MGDSYREGKLVMSKETGEVVSSIEMVIKALGTMVLVPEYESNSDVIGKKVLTGSIQKPILEGDFRTNALNKLNELITQL